MNTSQNINTAPAAVNRIFLVIILVLAVMMVTACGKENKSGGNEATPTAAPTATPTPAEIAPDSKDYDLTKYIGMPLADVISKVGKDYTVDPGFFGPGNDLVFTAEGFEKVHFMTNTDDVITIVYIDTPDKAIWQNIGNGLTGKMKYSELKKALGSNFAKAAPVGEDSDFTGYDSTAVAGDYWYVFGWNADPEKVDAVPDYLYFKKVTND